MMILRADSLCKRPRSKALYTIARAGNSNCRHQGNLIVAGHERLHVCQRLVPSVIEPRVGRLSSAFYLAPTVPATPPGP